MNFNFKSIFVKDNKIKRSLIQFKKPKNLDDFKHAKKGLRKQVQKFGSFMAGMVMPAVGILIAWGLWAALFLSSKDPETGQWISKGWVKSEKVASSVGLLVEPTMKYLIPTLIAFTAGKMVYDVRGGMLASFVVFAAIVGNDWLYQPGVMGNTLKLNGQNVTEIGAPNQIVAALLIAPLATLIFKRIEKLYILKIRAGFEMIVKNFGLALMAMALAALIFFGWGFAMFGISYIMVAIINAFTKANWAFPFMAVFTEPLRAMFLNNAVNHGVMVPLGMQDINVNKVAASWYFMVGGNPGPGFGLLIAYAVWRKEQRAAAAGSSVVQLVGGIHEVHYVYILAEPIMILSTIFGAMTSLAIVAIFGGGTATVISPGSIISVIAMSPGAKYIGVNVVAVFAGSVVAFLVASLIMIFKKKSNNVDASQDVVLITDDGISFAQTNSNSEKANIQKTNELHAKTMLAANQTPHVSQTNEAVQNLKSKEVPNSLQPVGFDWQEVKLITVACDAGMGSSAMAAGIIRKFARKNNLKIEINNCAVKDLTNDPDVIVTLTTFVEIAREHNARALIYPLTNFLGQGIYDELFKAMTENLPKLEISK